MRLLKIRDDGTVTLTRDLVGDNDRVPRYAILSHIWQQDDQEVTFDDIIHNTGTDKAGYNKIRFCAQQAIKDKLRYVWIDTCCINKAVFIELQDAINSMFRWYQDAAKCYVFLSDVSTAKQGDNVSHADAWERAFQASRWFTRGWTLQELLAPREIQFFSLEGIEVGTKQNLKDLIHKVTDIPIEALLGSPLSDFGVEARFSWAEKRQTTRKEDRAYSLLGIFGLFMPLMYGEGPKNAFQRLKKVIQEDQEMSTRLLQSKNEEEAKRKEEQRKQKAEEEKKKEERRQGKQGLSTLLNYLLISPQNVYSHCHFRNKSKDTNAS